MVEVLDNLASTVRHVIGRTRIVLAIWTISTVEHVCQCTLRLSFVHSNLSIPSADLRALGQTTRIERSTVEQVRARIAYLREKTKDASNAKAFDFDQRLAEIRAKELAAREEKKNQKKAQREKARIELAQQTAAESGGADVDMMNMMGFGGFGSTKK